MVKKSVNFFKNVLDSATSFSTLKQQTFLSIKTKWEKSYLVDPLLMPFIYPFFRIACVF